MKRPFTLLLDFFRMGLAGAALMIFMSGLASSQGAAPFRLSLDREAGESTETPGINIINVVYTFSFGQPVGKGDIEHISLKANNVDISKLLVSPRRLEHVDASTLRVAIPLPEIMEAGAAFSSDGASIQFDCTVKLKGSPPLQASSAYNFVEQKEVSPPSQPPLEPTKPSGKKSPISTDIDVTNKKPQEIIPKSELEEGIPPKGPDEISVAITGPITDDIENRIYRYLGALRIDFLLKVDRLDQVIPAIAQVSKTTKKRIKYLVIAGHGSPDPNQAGFGIGGWLFGLDRVDVPSIEKDYSNEIRNKKEKMRALADLTMKIDLARGKLDPLDQISEESQNPELAKLLAQKKALDGEIAVVKNKLKRLHTVLSDIDDVWGVMADQSVIVLFNCYSGMQEHVVFAEAIGSVLFGERNGTVIISEKTIGIGEIPEYEKTNNPNTWFWQNLTTSIFQAVGYVTEGYWKKPGEAILWFDYEAKPIEGQIYKPIPKILDVDFEPPVMVLNVPERVEVQPQVAKFHNSGTVVLDCGSKSDPSKCVIDPQGKEGRLVEATIKASDQKGRKGEGEVFLWVKGGNVEIELSKESPPPGEVITAIARLVRGEMPPESSWIWRAEGGLTLASENYKQAIQVQVNGPGTLTVMLYGLGPFGKERVYAQSRATITPGKDRKQFKQCFNPIGADPSLIVCVEYSYIPEKQTAAGTAGCIIDGTVKISKQGGPQAFEIEYKNGVMDGQYVVYGDTGQPGIKGNFKNGLEEGRWTWWYANGNKMNEIDFSNGKVNGSILSWYENGLKQSQGKCSQGRKVGTWSHWSEDGRLLSDTVYTEYDRTETSYDGDKKHTSTERGTWGSGSPDTLAGTAESFLAIPEGCSKGYFNKKQ